jgi:hypothetical protein
MRFSEVAYNLFISLIPDPPSFSSVPSSLPVSIFHFKKYAYKKIGENLKKLKKMGKSPHVAPQLLDSFYPRFSITETSKFHREDL